MAMFDPQKAREQNKNQGIPAGDYLLAISSFTRKTSKKGKAYLNARIVVIHGAAKKRSFFDNISLDTDNSGAMFRLGMLAEQAGVEQAFDLDSDEEIRANLVGRPFKARVSRKVEGEYTNNGIERYLGGDKITDGERAIMEQWLIDAAAEDEWNGGGSGGDDPYANDGAPPPGDDDIPF